MMRNMQVPAYCLAFLGVKAVVHSGVEVEVKNTMAMESVLMGIVSDDGVEVAVVVTIVIVADVMSMLKYGYVLNKQIALDERLSLGSDVYKRLSITSYRKIAEPGCSNNIEYEHHVEAFCVETSGYKRSWLYSYKSQRDCGPKWGFSYLHATHQLAQICSHAHTTTSTRYVLEQNARPSLTRSL